MKTSLIFGILLIFYITTATSAPTLVKSIPSNGATGISITTKIILQFSEDVVLGTGDCKFNGETLSPTIASKYVTFQPNGMVYLSNYTFTAPAGAFKNKIGEPLPEITFSFTTTAKPQPVAKLFDAVVAKDGSGNYTTVQKAIDAMPNNRTLPWLVFVKNGVYNELIRIPSNKSHLHLVGQDKEKTIIQYKINCASDANSAGWDFSANKFGIAVGSVVAVDAPDFFSENISYVNTWGAELKIGPQALAMYTRNDRIVFNNCKMLSYQDTWQTTTDPLQRHFAKNCFIEGAVDFIYCSGDCYLDSCTLSIVREIGGYIVAPIHYANSKWGYIFMNCNITAPKPSTVYLGRPWHGAPKASFVNTTLSKNMSIYPVGWYDHMGGIPAIFADYNTVNHLGVPVSLSQRNNYYYFTNDAGVKVEGYAQKTLTEEQVKSYTIRNVMGGVDNWNPEEMTKAIATPSVKTVGDKLIWNRIPYAICYVVTRNDSVIGFTKDSTFNMTSVGSYKIMSANEYGGLSTASVATSKLSSAVVDINRMDIPMELIGNKLFLKGLDAIATIRIYSMTGSLLESYAVEGDSEIVLNQSVPCLIILTAEKYKQTVKYYPF